MRQGADIRVSLLPRALKPRFQVAGPQFHLMQTALQFGHARFGFAQSRFCLLAIGYFTQRHPDAALA